MFGPYTKTIWAFLAAVAGILGAALTGGITASEWVNIGIQVAGAAAVFAAPNVPGARYTKFILAALLAALTVLSSAIVGGVTSGEWSQIIASVLGTAAVYQFSNSNKAVV